MSTHSGPIYSDMRDAFFEELFKLAKKDRNILLLMADQDAMTFEKFRKEIPKQLINVGIGEQNMISVAAGLAMCDKKVFVHAIANFTTIRVYEQIKIDLSIMNSPVTIVGVGAGFAYGSDGPTHHANQDIAAMRAIPGMTILNAADTVSLSTFPVLAYKSKGPVYVRFDKGKTPIIYDEKTNFEEGLAKIKNGNDLIIISSGLMVSKALTVADKLKIANIEVGIIDLYRLKPLNEKLLYEFIKKAKGIITLEEHLAYGGVGTIISDFLADHNLCKQFKRFGLPDKHCFVYGSRDYMLEKSALSSARIVNEITKWMS